MIEYFRLFSSKLILAFVEHLVLSGVSLLLAIVCSLGLVVILVNFPKIKESSVYILSLIYSIPSFALFTLLIPLLGLGQITAIIVLVLYAQYILVRSFLVSLDSISEELIEAAFGMGMTEAQIFRQVRLPLAKKGIFSGVRLAATSIVAIATIASVVNAGGLGLILFEGLRSMNQYELAWGILLTVLISLWINSMLFALERLCD